jgi:hypothetical protein
MKSGVKYTIELIKVGRREKKRKMAIRASMMYCLYLKSSCLISMLEKGKGQ